MTESFEKILNAIKHYCQYQERCHKDVRYKLVALSARNEELETIIAILIEGKFLDEERFAKAYVRGKFNYNHWGKTKIIQGLKLKEISEYCIKKGLSEIDEKDYLQLIEKLITSKQKEVTSIKNAAVRKQKIIRYLLQKGFSFNDIQKVYE